MARHLAITEIDYLHRQGLTGKGVLAGVLDLGVAAVPDLQSNLIGSYTINGDQVVPANPVDPIGHGTSIGGILAGTGVSSGGQYKGIAPQSKLVYLQFPVRQVRNQKMIFEGSADMVANGIRWFIRQKDAFRDPSGQSLPLRLLVIPMGKKFNDNGEPYLSPDINPINLAIQEAEEENILSICAAGNYGPKSRTILSSPSNEPVALTVGASDHKNQDKRQKSGILSESSFGPTLEGIQKPEIVAPGNSIVSTKAPNSIFDSRGKLINTILKLTPQEFYMRLRENKQAFYPVFEFKGNINHAEPTELYNRCKRQLPESGRLIGEHYFTTIGGTSTSCAIVGGGIILLRELTQRMNITVTSKQLKSIVMKSCDMLLDVRESAQGFGHVNFRKASFNLMQLKQR